ncbi:ATP-binding cassette domain-containing protein, partial [Acinetobacter baumannii]|nr:ATP-binding cassette domain-containing protein [Acinetobacter baumannii]
MIQFKNIAKSYGPKKVLENLSLDIEAGEFITMLGSSGSGKTTLLKMVNRLVEPDSGSIHIHQKDIQTMDV